jgi:predicted GNAT family acetyltransferase
MPNAYVKQSIASMSDKEISELLTATVESTADGIYISRLAILHYLAANTPAQTLYENMGFKYSSANPFYFAWAGCRG